MHDKQKKQTNKQTLFLEEKYLETRNCMTVYHNRQVWLFFSSRFHHEKVPILKTGEKEYSNPQVVSDKLCFPIFITLVKEQEIVYTSRICKINDF